MPCRKLAGFSAAEMLASLAIVLILALATVFELNSYQKGEELRTAARQLAADIRSVQSSAFSARNIKACMRAGQKSVCEYSDSGCVPNTCISAIPQSYGISVTASSSTYMQFADLNPASPDYKYNDGNELVINRNVNLLNGSSVTVDRILADNVAGPTRADITFLRQSGNVSIVLVPDMPATIVTIVLRHVKSGALQNIEINKVTGRISVL